MRIEERVQGGVGALRRPDAGARRPYQASKLVVVICILAIAARLILINQPFVDHWSWRQSDVAAIARNFAEGGFRFAYPQIDWAGDATGCWYGISHSAVCCRDLLQICGYSRMDWTQPSRSLLRRFAAIFLFARTRDLREHSSGLGGIFLQFRAA